MTRSLRKACRSCTLAKRRCIVQLPRCHRCEVKHIDCVYDLEPLLGDSRSSYKGKFNVKGTTTDVERGGDFRNSFLHFVSSLHMDPNRTPIGLFENPISQCPIVSKVPLSVDAPTVEYMVGELLRIAHSVFGSQPSPFIHPHLQPQPQTMLSKTGLERPRSLRPHFNTESRRSVPLHDQTGQLLSRLNHPAVPLREALRNFQLFICSMIWLLFSSDTGKPQVKEKLIEQMRAVAARMMRDAPAMMPTDLSRWETWMLAESVRRVILMSCLLQGIYHGWVGGFCYHELFIQALPFDTRLGLWNAESEDEWEALLADGGDLRLGSKSASPALVSFYEFASSFARAPFDPGPDTFQRLLLTAHHGKGPVDRALGTMDA